MATYYVDTDTNISTMTLAENDTVVVRGGKLTIDNTVSAKINYSIQNKLEINNNTEDVISVNCYSANTFNLYDGADILINGKLIEIGVTNGVAGQQVVVDKAIDGFMLYGVYIEDENTWYSSLSASGSSQTWSATTDSEMEAFTYDKTTKTITFGKKVPTAGSRIMIPNIITHRNKAEGEMYHFSVEYPISKASIKGLWTYSTYGLKADLTPEGTVFENCLVSSNSTTMNGVKGLSFERCFIHSRNNGTTLAINGCEDLTFNNCTVVVPFTTKYNKQLIFTNCKIRCEYNYYLIFENNLYSGFSDCVFAQAAPTFKASHNLKLLRNTFYGSTKYTISSAIQLEGINDAQIDDNYFDMKATYYTINLDNCNGIAIRRNTIDDILMPVDRQWYGVMISNANDNIFLSNNEIIRRKQTGYSLYTSNMSRRITSRGFTDAKGDMYPQGAGKYIMLGSQHDFFNTSGSRGFGIYESVKATNKFLSINMEGNVSDFNDISDGVVVNSYIKFTGINQQIIVTVDCDIKRTRQLLSRQSNQSDCDLFFKVKGSDEWINEATMYAITDLPEVLNFDLKVVSKRAFSLYQIIFNTEIRDALYSDYYRNVNINTRLLPTDKDLNMSIKTQSENIETTTDSQETKSYTYLYKDVNEVVKIQIRKYGMEMWETSSSITDRGDTDVYYTGKENRELSITESEALLIDGVMLGSSSDSEYTWELDCGGKTLTQAYSYIQAKLSNFGTLAGIDTFELNNFLIKSGNSFTSNHIRDNEGVKIVNFVGSIAKMQKDDGSYYVPPTLIKKVFQATKLVNGTKVQFFNVTKQTELGIGLVSGGVYTIEFDGDDTSVDIGDVIRMRATYVNGATAKEGIESFGQTPETGITFIDVQKDDLIYNAIGIDGSSVDEFYADGANLQVDINDSDGVTTIQRGISWYKAYLYTNDGIRIFFGGLNVKAINDIEINTDLVPFQLENISNTPITINGGRISRKDGGSIFAPTSKSILINATGFLVHTVETGVSGLTASESEKLDRIGNIEVNVETLTAYDSNITIEKIDTMIDLLGNIKTLQTDEREQLFNVATKKDVLNGLLSVNYES